MVAEKVEGQIVQKMSFKFRLANHFDEPPKNKDCVSKGFHNPLSLISIAQNEFEMTSFVQFVIQLCRENHFTSLK